MPCSRLFDLIYNLKRSHVLKSNSASPHDGDRSEMSMTPPHLQVPEETMSRYTNSYTGMLGLAHGTCAFMYVCGG